MPILLLTGLPGNGKSYLAVGHLKDYFNVEGRQIFHNGIPGLKLPWTECDPKKWMELPDNSIVVIDEAQDTFRVPKMGSERPYFVTQLEVHRHRGFDFVLMTQDANLIDSHVRRLCQPHVHVERVFGFQRCKVFEWQTVQTTIDYHARKAAQVKQMKFLPEVYNNYKSATHHTIKRRVPAKLWWLIVAVVALLGVAYKTFTDFRGMASGEAAAKAQGKDPKKATPPTAGVQPYNGKISFKNTNEYIASYEPRIRDLLYTAPRYDELTAPKQVPQVVACHADLTARMPACTCLTQQGSIADVSRAFCSAFLQGRKPFLDYLPPPAEPGKQGPLGGSTHHAKAPAGPQDLIGASDAPTGSAEKKSTSIFGGLVAPTKSTSNPGQ
jgi:zona occludens toxin